MRDSSRPLSETLTSEKSSGDGGGGNGSGGGVLGARNERKSKWPARGSDFNGEADVTVHVSRFT